MALSRALSRRQVSDTAASAAAVGTLPSVIASQRVVVAPTSRPTRLRVSTCTIDTDGKTVRVFGIRQPDRTHAPFTERGERLRGTLVSGLGAMITGSGQPTWIRARLHGIANRQTQATPLPHREASACAQERKHAAKLNYGAIQTFGSS